MISSRSGTWAPRHLKRVPDMHGPRAARGAFVVSLFAALAAPALAAPGAAVLVRPHGPGVAADTSWIPDAGSGLRLVGDGARVMVAPAATPPSRFIVRFTEDAGAQALAAPERVAARDALERSFEHALATRQPGRFNVSGDAGIRVTRRYDRLIAGAAVE